MMDACFIWLDDTDETKPPRTMGGILITVAMVSWSDDRGSVAHGWGWNVRHQ